MTRLSQIAAPAIVGAALMFGAAGCAEKEPPVPARAQIAGEGREIVTANAVSDGTVYIYDDTSNKSVYTGRVDRGDVVKLDAKQNRVLLNDKVALERDLVNDHRYLIYFDPKIEAGTAAHRDATMQGGSTVIKNPDGTSTVITPGQSGTNTTVVTPAQPAQPAQPAPPAQPATIPPPPPANNGTTVVQPDGTTVVTPSR